MCIRDRDKPREDSYYFKIDPFIPSNYTSQETRKSAFSAFDNNEPNIRTNREEPRREETRFYREEPRREESRPYREEPRREDSRSYREEPRRDESRLFNSGDRTTSSQPIKRETTTPKQDDAWLDEDDIFSKKPPRSTTTSASIQSTPKAAWQEPPSNTRSPAPVETSTQERNLPTATREETPVKPAVSSISSLPRTKTLSSFRRPPPGRNSNADEFDTQTESKEDSPVKEKETNYDEPPPVQLTESYNTQSSKSEQEVKKPEPAKYEPPKIEAIKNELPKTEASNNEAPPVQVSAKTTMNPLLLRAQHRSNEEEDDDDDWGDEDDEPPKKNEPYKTVDLAKSEPTVQPVSEAPSTTSSLAQSNERRVTQGGALAKFQKSVGGGGATVSQPTEDKGADAKKKVFSVAREVCHICGKTVYQTEKVQIKDSILHNNCFKCKHCGLKLKLTNYAPWEGDFYCKPHFHELFAMKGFKGTNTDDNDGEVTKSEPKREEPKKVEPKPEPKIEEPKKVEPKPEPKIEEPKKVEPKKEESKPAEPVKGPTNEEPTEKKGFSVKRETCNICGKTVYQTEKVQIKDTILHNSCFKCKHCGLKLKLTNYAPWENDFYCKPHFNQLGFAKKKISETMPKTNIASQDSSNPVVTEEKETTPAPATETESKSEPSKEEESIFDDPTLVFDKEDTTKPSSTASASASTDESKTNPNSLKAKSLAFYSSLDSKDDPKSKPAASSGGGAAKKSFSVARDVCHTCGKTVYAAEKVQIKDTIFHRLCFKCKHCGCALKLTNYSPWEGEFYCKPHFHELFSSVGFSENRAQKKDSEEGGPPPTKKAPQKKVIKKDDDGESSGSLLVKWRKKGVEKSITYEFDESTTLNDILVKCGATAAKFALRLEENGQDSDLSQTVKELFDGQKNPAVWVVRKRRAK
eukprot:TRINITY_DN4155_c0_g2_i1.p1 TRINITY_DN4155_c0_g2~~TRINITY_DN4155_c0_g2_i1.p1  ORF type:complete len:919 (+),score=256.25 TRINITY_DN4155_c0_g2_i1:2-2758(+)